MWWRTFFVCSTLGSAVVPSSALEGISVVIRNLSGRKIDVSWLSPGAEPRQRVKQSPKPVSNGSTTSINSYVSHEFVVTLAEDEAAAKAGSAPAKAGSAPAADQHESCGFWASLNECALNPGYMLASCAASCFEQRALEGGLAPIRARFAVEAFEEFIDVFEDWRLERDSETKRAARAVADFWAQCEANETCLADAGGGFLRCVRKKAALYVAEKRAKLDLEREIAHRARARFPASPPPPKQGSKEPPEREDFGANERLYLGAAALADAGFAGCPADEAQTEATRDCLATTLGTIAEAATKATSAQRKITRARSELKRNESCATAVATTAAVGEPFEFQYDALGDDVAWRFGAMPTELAVTEPVMTVIDLFFRPEAMPEARISLIDNFLSDEECDAMVAQATPRLVRATHAHDGDLHYVSEVRNSQQATVRPHMRDARNLSDPIARVRARSVGLANELSGYSLAVDGQEDLMAIQYKEHQQYMLHCDGSCDGTPHLQHGRLATVLMYCSTATEGGATSFPNADVHIVPRRGQAAYFHFRGPEANSRTDLWHTEHSGCPVKAGVKWVVTQWLRDGVNAKENARLYAPFGFPVGDS